MWKALTRPITAALCTVAVAGCVIVEAPQYSAPVPYRDNEPLSPLDKQVMQLYAQGKFREALPLARRMMEERERVYGPNHPVTARGIGYYALVLGRLGDFTQSEKLLRHALEIFERTLGYESDDVGLIFNNLGRILQEMGRLPEAEDYLRRALELTRRVLGPWHPEVAVCLSNLGVLVENRGDLDSAEAMFKEALRIRERVRPPDHPDIAESLTNLGEVQKARGYIDAAERSFRKALAIREKALGPEHPDVGRSLNALATVLLDRGNVVEAEPLLWRALNIKVKAFGWEHPDIAIETSNLANLMMERGDYAKVAALTQSTLTLVERKLGPDHMTVAIVTANLAHVKRFTGELADAEVLARRALAIHEKLFGHDNRAVADSLAGLAAVLSDRGKYADAEALAREALRIRERKLGPDHPMVLDSLQQIAIFRRDQHDYRTAEGLLRRAEASLEKLMGPEHPDVPVALENLAILSAVQGRPREGIPGLRRAADIEEQLADVVLASGSPRRKSTYFATLEASSWLVAAFHAQYAFDDRDALRLAATTALRRKGRVLEASAETVQALHRQAVPEVASKMAELSSLQSQLEMRVMRGPLSNETAEVHSAALNKLRGAIDHLEGELGDRYGKRRPHPEAVTIEAVTKRLGAGAALIDFIRYRAFDPSAAQRQRWGKWRYVAYLLKGNGEVAAKDLGDAASIDKLVGELRERLANRDSNFREAARALDARLLQPFRPALGSVRNIYLSPDGPLNLLPFGALIDADGEFLVTRYLLTVLTSGRDLIRFDQTTPPRTEPVIVTSPDFEGDAAVAAAPKSQQRSADLGAMRFSPLPNLAIEGAEIHKLFPKALLLVSADANETAIKALHAPRILHIATHGFFLEDRASTTSGDRRVQFQAANPSALTPLLKTSEDPLLRSGLALSGANRLKSGADDGILTALEVSGMDLSGTRLVVLSACDTGVGEVTNGDGIFGLRRGFVLAGAESQIMSLWKVDDGATRALMVDYYRRLKNGVGRSEALRQAQIKLLESAYGHPYYWAAFIASGSESPITE